MSLPQTRSTVDGALAVFRKALRQRAGAEDRLTPAQIGAAFVEAHPGGARAIAGEADEDSGRTSDGSDSDQSRPKGAAEEGESVREMMERAKEEGRAQAEKESGAVNNHFYLS